MCSRAARPAELRGALGPLPRQLGAQRLIVERALERGGERRHIAASGMKRPPGSDLDQGGVIAGTASQVEVSDAEAALYQSESAALQQRLSVEIAALRVAKAVGAFDLPPEAQK